MASAGGEKKMMLTSVKHWGLTDSWLTLWLRPYNACEKKERHLTQA